MIVNKYLALFKDSTGDFTLILNGTSLNLLTMAILKKQLKELGDLIGEGHRRFGKVAPRRPYLEDDDSGGEGGSRLSPFAEHPLLASVPIGASSDLTFLTAENKFSSDEAEKRVDEASPQLTKQLENVLGFKMAARPKVTPTPYAGGY
ncbi:MAG: hypothetical protein WCW01_03095 [Gammaproteobacteria bacterium]